MQAVDGHRVGVTERKMPALPFAIPRQPIATGARATIWGAEKQKRPKRGVVACYLAETEGFEPSIQVYARMLP
jgi:hypothetical protein